MVDSVCDSRSRPRVPVPVCQNYIYVSLCCPIVAVFHLPSRGKKVCRQSSKARCAHKQYRFAFHARRSRVVLDFQTVSWGENVEVPPESDDDEDGTGSGEEGSAGENGEEPGRYNTADSNLDAIADGFVDDDFLKSDDDDDDDDSGEVRRIKEKGVIGQAKERYLQHRLEESTSESDVASKRAAASASNTGEKVRASAPTTIPLTRREIYAGRRYEMGRDRRQ